MWEERRSRKLAAIAPSTIGSDHQKAGRRPPIHQAEHLPIPLPRKTAIGRGVSVGMEDPQCCKPVDMVRFLLAFCCDDSSSDTICDTQVLNERFEDCWRKVVPVANSGEMKRRLEK